MPEIAKYFDGTENEEEEGNGLIDQLECPELPEGYPVFAHWEEAAKRILQNLMRAKCAWLFAAPVDAEALGLKDYYTIIKSPMDFGTIKGKIKDHKYKNVQGFMDDIDLTFNNCAVYNGLASDVGRMGQSVQEEYVK